jgi:SAM-dependent methyltransferase
VNAPFPSTCPVCGGRQVPDLATPRLDVLCCGTCGHRVARHLSSPPAERDYHLQYEGGAFVAALEATRRRQAHAIVELARRHAPDARSVFDFGCGRGWFLEECRARGFHVAGADSSRVAVDSLAARGIESFVVRPGSDLPALVRTLSFEPEILTILDVVEHFPPEQCVEITRGIVGAFGRVKLVVVKVPVSSGLLYRTSRALSALGSDSAIEQLYQVGTDPPHLAYFSPRSIVGALSSAGLVPLETHPDPDFEPESLAGRAKVLATAPAWAARTIGRSAAFVARGSLADSLIVASRP